MIDRSKTKKILGGLVGLMVGAFTWTAPADAQWAPMHGGWGHGGYHPRHVVRHYPPRYRRVVVVRHPRYGRRFGHPVYGHRPRWERPWHHRRRCFLPERYLCR